MWTHLLRMRRMLHRVIGGLAILILLCKCASFACENHYYKYNLRYNIWKRRHLIGLFLVSFSPAQNGDALQKIRLSVAEHGDNVTLTCRIATVVTAFYLNKIKFGYLPQVVATGYGKVSVREQFTSRFTATKEDFLYRFVIRNVSKEDEATYFCQAGTAYNMSFTDGTTLVVNGNTQAYLTLFWLSF